jgi:hypothetical protein
VSASRPLPCSIEAEEYLLSCCLLDGADVVSRCLDARIKPESFYDLKHGVVYEKLLDLYNRQQPIDVSVVAEELKTSRLLDAIGGYAFLTQVSSKIPTTAQASYFIEKVHEQAALRGIIRAANGAAEDCYGFSGDIAAFASEVRQKLEHATDGATGAVSMLAEREFKPGAPIIDAPVAFRLGDVVVSTAGNLTNYVGQTGVGKSAIVDALMAAPLTRDNAADCLGFTSFNAKELPLLHFDTEQSAADYQRLLLRSLRRAGLQRHPAWLHSYHLTGLAASQCREMVRLAMSHHARKAGGLFAVIIDGWGDLVVNPNDEDECFPFVAEMHGMAIKYGCAIVGVLHLNPGSESKSRGHLGSQLERKAEAVLQLEMVDGVTSLWATKKRGAPIPKSAAFRFKWSSEAAMHVSCQTATLTKDDAKREKMRDMADAVFSHLGKDGARYAELLQAIQQVRRISASTAEDRFTDMKRLGVISKDPLGFWRINPVTP